MMKFLFLLSVLFVLYSCMHVIDLGKEPIITARIKPEISLNLNRLSNETGANADYFEDVIESGDYYIAVGRSQSDWSGTPGGTICSGNYDPFIAKIRKSDLAIERVNNDGDVNWEELTAVIESGDYYVGVGDYWSDGFYIVKYNKSDLSIADSNKINGTSTDSFYALTQAGNYYIAVGYTLSDLSAFSGGGPNQGSFDFIIAKFDASDLSLVRISNFGGADADYFNEIIEADGYYIASGYSWSDLSGLTGGTNVLGTTDFVVAKIEPSDLSLISINNPGGTGSDYFNSIIDADDYYIATGYSNSNLSGFTGGSGAVGNYDFVVAKINKSDLSINRINNLGGTGDDRFYSIIESGNYYVAAGYSASNLSALEGGSTSTGSEDFVIAKFNKSELSLVELNNIGGTSYDYLYSLIDAWDHYIGVGASGSNLSGFTGGSTNQGTDFVIMKFCD